MTVNAVPVLAAVAAFVPLGQVGGFQGTLDPQVVIGAAVSNSLAQGHLFAEQIGWVDERGRRVSDVLTRLWYKSPNLVYVESYLDGAMVLRIVADGSKVWRYNAVRNEYSFSTQPGGIQQTLQVMASWARREDQWLLRLLAGSSNWLVLPAVQYNPSPATIQEVVQEKISWVGGDWRGERHTFRFDDFYPSGKMSRLVLESKVDAPNGLRHSLYDTTFSYPAQFSFQISFTPPPGAKPAADLPGRVGG
jgi:hypothetical protein